METGSAGEQPVRDNLDDWRKSQWKGFCFRSPL